LTSKFDIGFLSSGSTRTACRQFPAERPLHEQIRAGNTLGALLDL
jgi:hypothetical protein